MIQQITFCKHSYVILTTEIYYYASVFRVAVKLSLILRRSEVAPLSNVLYLRACSCHQLDVEYLLYAIRSWSQKVDSKPQLKSVASISCDRGLKSNRVYFVCLPFQGNMSSGFLHPWADLKPHPSAAIQMKETLVLKRRRPKLVLR